MSRLTPCKRREFIAKLRSFGFDGPFSGTRHQFMTFGQKRLAVPSNGECSVPQLRMMLRECVAVKVRQDDAFVVTAYLTDRTKKGIVLWPIEL